MASLLAFIMFHSLLGCIRSAEARDLFFCIDSYVENRSPLPLSFLLILSTCISHPHSFRLVRSCQQQPWQTFVSSQSCSFLQHAFLCWKLFGRLQKQLFAIPADLFIIKENLWTETILSIGVDHQKVSYHLSLLLLLSIRMIHIGTTNLTLAERIA